MPRALATLAASADVRGYRARADGLLRAVSHVVELSSAERRDLLKGARRGQTPAGWPAEAFQALLGMAERGPSAVVDAELARLPADLTALLRLPDVDPADVIRAHRRHGLVTAADIAVEAAFDESQDLSAEDRGALGRLARWLPSARGSRRRLPLGHAVGLIEALGQALDPADQCGTLHPMGSVRRFEPTVGDVAALLVHDAPEDALARSLERLAPADVRHRGPSRAVFHHQGEEVALRACSALDAPFVALWHTGSAAHLRQLRRCASEKGFDLGPRHLRDAHGVVVPCASEADIYAALGLAYVPPELRHGDDEIQRASAGPLPQLVDVADIRGDLHMHTLFSDGRDSVETMVHAARALGYEYMAITDHSPSAAASRRLSLDRIERQVEDVERARRRVPGITILYGVEVDILPDGSLDLPDHVIDRLDIVLASLHEPAGHGPDRLLARYLSAIDDPRVNIVTHPANRLVGRHEGYELDYDALFAAAVRTGTALEIDGGPGHLDMDGTLARRAVAAGVTVTIDSDCHNALRLGRQMRLGVGTARRGGVEARHVLNARPLNDVLAFIAGKRQRGAARP